MYDEEDQMDGLQEANESRYSHGLADIEDKTFSDLISREAFTNKNLTLTPEMEIDLRAYFARSKRLIAAGEKYPYSLDELVPSVFSRKQTAIDALADGFKEVVDFVPLTVESKSSLGGLPRISYRLTAKCFEFMVARKCRPVFNVYWDYFNDDTKPTPATEMPAWMPSAVDVLGQLTMEHKRVIADHEARITKLEEAKAPTSELMTATQLGQLMNPPLGNKTVNKRLVAANLLKDGKPTKLAEKHRYAGYHLTSYGARSVRFGWTPKAIEML